MIERGNSVACKMEQEREKGIKGKNGNVIG
jgi:hypothetical protein